MFQNMAQILAQRSNFNGSVSFDSTENLEVPLMAENQILASALDHMEIALFHFCQKRLFRRIRLNRINGSADNSLFIGLSRRENLIEPSLLTDLTRSPRH